MVSDLSQRKEHRHHLWNLAGIDLGGGDCGGKTDKLLVIAKPVLKDCNCRLRLLIDSRIGSVAELE